MGHCDRMTRRTVLFVGAHPDDDTFGIARSMALHAADPDLRFVLVHATDGDAGEIAPDVEVPPDELGAFRRREDEMSWMVMGRVPDRHEWLGLPDGRLDQVDRQVLVRSVSKILVEEAPDVVATFGPDGITGHPDHVAVGHATTEAFMRGVERGGPGFRRLLHACIPRRDIERWNTERTAHGEPPWDATIPFHLRGVPDEKVHISVDTRAVADRAVAALRTHRSQWSPAQIPVRDEVMAASLATEDWTVAWPPPPDGQPVLTDILERL